MGHSVFDSEGLATMKIIILCLLATTLGAETGEKSEKVKRGILLGSEGLDLGSGLSQTNLDGIPGGLSNGISGLGQGFTTGLSGGLSGGLNTGITGASIRSDQQQVPLIVSQPYPITRPVTSPYTVRQNFQSLRNEVPVHTPQITSRRLSFPENLRIPRPIPISETSRHQLFIPRSMQLSRQSPVVVAVSSESQSGLSSGISSALNSGIIGNGANGGLGSGLGLSLSSGLGNVGASGSNLGSGSSSGLVSLGTGSGFGSNLGLSNLGSGLGSQGSIFDLGTSYGSGYGYSASGIGGLGAIRGINSLDDLGSGLGGGNHLIVITKH